jgi:hypothetical protein
MTKAVFGCFIEAVFVAFGQACEPQKLMLSVFDIPHFVGLEAGLRRHGSAML